MSKKTKRRIRNVLLAIIALLLLSLAGGYVLAQVYKKEILEAVNKSVNEKISGELQIKDIEFAIFNHFPSFSLTLQDAVLRDSMYAVHGVELFHAEKIVLEVELSKLLRGEVNLRSVTITNATVSLVKMKNGYSNTSIIRKNTAPKETDTKSSLTATIDKVFLKNVQFSMVDSSKNKWFRIDFKDVGQTLNITPEHVKSKVIGTIYFGGLAFNADKGSYLTNKTVKVKLFLDFNIPDKQLQIKSSTLEIDNKNLLLRGSFVFGDTSQMHLEIDAPSITVQQANTIVTQHIASKLLAFNFEKPLTAAIRINGRLYPGSKPAVDVFFKTEDNVLLMKTKTFTEVSALGWFLNHVDSTQLNDDHNSQVILSRFNATLYGIPLRSQVTITDLIKPHLLMEAKVKMALEDVNGIVDTSKFVFSSGQLDVAFNYDGKLVEYVDTVNHLFLAKVKGRVKLSDANLLYVPHGFEFSEVNANMTFGDSLLNIDELRMKINDNAISVTGQIIQFIPFLFVPGRSLFANLEVHAGSIDFNNFTDKNRTAAKTRKKTTAQKKSSQKQVNQSIDNIIGTMEADVLLSAEKIVSGKFSATNLGGHILLSDDYLKFKEIKMTASDGVFGLNGSITGLQQAPYQLAISASVDNADISSLFYSLNNFNQKVITHENLKGRLTSNGSFSSQLNKDYSIDPKSMNGKVVLSIKNGALINIEALDKISEYVFKNRDFNNIEFAQLKDTIWLKGQQITYSRMQIQSSVATLYTEGTYGFNGGTDISVQIPLSNLKKRDKDYQPTNVAADTKLGASVFLRAREDSDGKIQIAYDPLKHYYKDKGLSTDSIKNAMVESTDQDSSTNKKNKKKQRKE
ncbi:MAG: AsmA-like C-terminal region-containing protein [Chitinophagales bacterium]